MSGAHIKRSYSSRESSSSGHVYPAAQLSTLDRIRSTARHWFFPSITRIEGARHLEGRDSGSFVVRESSKAGNYALTVVLPPPGTGFGHYLLEKGPLGGYCLQGSENIFATVEDLLAHYCDNVSAGMPCRLTVPLLPQARGNLNTLGGMPGGGYRLSPEPQRRPQYAGAPCPMPINRSLSVSAAAQPRHPVMEPPFQTSERRNTTGGIEKKPLQPPSLPARNSVRRTPPSSTAAYNSHALRNRAALGNVGSAPVPVPVPTQPPLDRSQSVHPVHPAHPAEPEHDPYDQEVYEDMSSSISMCQSLTSTTSSLLSAKTVSSGADEPFEQEVYEDMTGSMKISLAGSIGAPTASMATYDEPPQEGEEVYEDMSTAMRPGLGAQAPPAPAADDWNEDETYVDMAIGARK